MTALAPSASTPSDSSSVTRPSSLTTSKGGTSTAGAVSSTAAGSSPPPQAAAANAANTTGNTTQHHHSSQLGGSACQHSTTPDHAASPKPMMADPGHPRLPEGPLLPAAPSIPTHRLLGANPTRQTCAGNDERTPTLRPRPLDRPHPPHHRRRHAVRLDLDRTMAVGPHRSLPPPRRPRRRRLLHQGRQGTAVTRRPPRVCTRCRQTVPAGQPCPTCAPQLDREADARRGSAH